MVINYSKRGLLNFSIIKYTIQRLLLTLTVLLHAAASGLFVQYRIVVRIPNVVAVIGQKLVTVVEQKNVPVTLCALNASAPPTTDNIPITVNMLFAFFMIISTF